MHLTESQRAQLIEVYENIGVEPPDHLIDPATPVDFGDAVTGALTAMSEVIAEHDDEIAGDEDNEEPEHDA